MQPTTPSAKRQTHNNNLFIIAISVLALALVAGMVVVFLFRSDPPSTSQTSTLKRETVSAFTVGNQPYVYACSVLNRAKLYQAFNLSNDQTQEYINSNQAVPLTASLKTEADLLKTNDEMKNPRVDSSCHIRSFERGKGNFELIVRQYANEATARSDYAFKKEVKTVSSPVKPLPNVDETAYVQTNDILKNESGFVLYKNKIIEFSYEKQNASETSVTAVLQDVKATLETAQANRPFDFTNNVTFATKKVVDACETSNFNQIATYLGDAYYYPVEAKSAYDFSATPNTFGGRRGVNSSCELRFRYEAEKTAFEKLAEHERSRSIYLDRYPHNITVEIATHQSADDAKTAVEYEAKLESASKLSFGDAAVRVTKKVNDKDLRKVYDTCYVAFGHYRVTIGIEQSAVNKPYKTVPKKVTSETFQKIAESIKASLNKNTKNAS